MKIAGKAAAMWTLVLLSAGLGGCGSDEAREAYGDDQGPRVAAVPIAAPPTAAPPAAAANVTPSPTATPSSSPTATPSPTPIAGTPPAEPTPMATAAYQTTSPLKLVHPSQVPHQLWKLWDGTSENLVYVVHTGWDNMVFDLHMFEELVVPCDGWPQKHFFNKRRLNGNLWRWEVRPDGWHFVLDQQELLDYHLEGRVWCEGNKVLVEGHITNRGKQDWTDGIGLMCLRERNAKPFRTTHYRNAWVYPVGGAPQPVIELFHNEDYDPKKDNKYFNVWMNKAGEPRYEPHVSKEDQQGKRRIEARAQPGATVGGNREPLINCIHANLAITPAAGQTQDFHYEVEFSTP